MLKIIKKYCFQSTLLLVLLLSSLQIQAAMLVWSPPEVSPLVGESFTLTLQGSGFTEGTSGGGVNITWDSRILSLDRDSVVIFPVLNDSILGEFGSFNFIGDVSVTAGTHIASIFVSATSFFGTSEVNFDIADFIFTAVSSGQTAVTVASLAPITDPWFSDDLSFEYAVDISNASSVIAVVPLPPAVLLFASSLIGMFRLGVER